MSNTIAVQSSASNVKKFLEISNFTSTEVYTPLGMISKSVSISVPNDIDNLDEIEEKDLCFVVCDSEQKRETISTLLDDYGFDLPPIAVHLESDDNSDEQDIEDIIDDVEEKSFMFNRSRLMDFMGRIHETAVFSAGEIEFAEDGDEHKYLEEVNNSLKSIIDIESGNIFPKMIPQNSLDMEVFFLHDTDLFDVGEDEVSLSSHAYRIDNISVENTAPNQKIVDFSMVEDGRYLAVDNALVFSAIEGVVPGLVVVVFENAEHGDEDAPVPSIAMWKISHNWVEGLSDASVCNDYRDLINEIMHHRYGEVVGVNVHSTRDIPLTEYPFLPQSKYSKDIAFTALYGIEHAEDYDGDM